MLEPGTTLQRGYIIERVLGTGGMGCVYLARQIALGGRRVAIKEMVAHLATEEERARAAEQFHREAEMLAAIEHPGLVDVKDCFEENGSHYLVMQFIDGQTLDAMSRSASGFLQVGQVLEWMDAVCDVLACLHGNRPPIIVRDLKPGNLMLDSTGRVRLIDFGIARIFEPDTATSTFIKGAGTAGFAPVEQYGPQGGTDHRADIYALGATTYALLTRSIPPWSVALATGETQMVPPSAMNPAIPPEVDAVIMRMMAVRRDDRYQTVQEAREALRVAAAAPPRSVVTRVAVPSRYCPECGATVVPSHPNCPRCGKLLSGLQMPPQPAHSPQPPTMAHLPSYPPVPHPATWRPPQRGGGSGWIVLVVIAALAAMVWAGGRTPPTDVPSVNGSWTGTMRGNDPEIIVKLDLRQDGLRVTGHMWLSSVRSGQHTREVEGRWDASDSAWILEDVRIDSPGDGTWRFCKVERYVLRPSGSRMAGTYVSSQCRDQGTLDLTRAP